MTQPIAATTACSDFRLWADFEQARPNASSHRKLRIRLSCGGGVRLYHATKEIWDIVVVVVDASLLE